MRKALIALVLLIVLLVAGGALYLKSIDANAYRGLIARQVKAATGRELALEGPVSLALGWSPALVMEGARFANARWGTRPFMARLERLEVEVALLPLLKREIRIRRLVLVGPDILLETDKGGRGNWVFGTAGGGGGAPGVAVGDVRLEGAKLTYRDGRSGRSYRLALDRLSARAEEAGGPVRVELRGAVEGLPLAARGTAGPLLALGRPGRPFAVDAEAELAGLSLKVKGAVAEPLEARGIDLRLAAEAAGLAGLKPLAGEAVAGLGATSLSARLRGEAKTLRIEDIRLRAGGSDLSGALAVDARGARPRVTGQLASKRLALTGPAGGEKRPAPPRKKIFSRDPLPLGALRSADADVEFTAEEVAAPAVTLRSVSARLLLRGGHLEVEPLKARLAGGEAAGRLSLDARPRPPALAARLRVKGLAVERLLRGAGMKEMVRGKADLALDVRGRGESVAAVMGSLNGQTRLLMGAGQASTEGLDLAVGGMTQVLGTLISGRRDFAKLHCAASDFAIRGGVATSRVLVADGEYATLVGEGRIHLGSERLDMKVTPRAKSVTLNVAVPVNIRGTLANPTFRPDALAAARKIGGLLGVFVFPPAAVVGLGEMGSSDNPCLKIIAGRGGAPPAQQKSTGPLGAVESTGKTIVEGVGKGIGKIGEGLKGLFGR